MLKIMMMIVTFLAFNSILMASPMTTQKLTVHGKIPQGAAINHNKIVVQKGYVIKKVSRHRAVMMRRMQGGITGSFDCTCNGNDGGCDVVTTPNSVTCASSTCKSSCYMITTIPGPKNLMHQ